MQAPDRDGAPQIFQLTYPGRSPWPDRPTAGQVMELWILPDGGRDILFSGPDCKYPAAGRACDTREGMQVAKAKGRLRGKQPKLTKSQEAHLVSLYKGGQYTTTEIAELFKVARSTVYRIVQRMP